MLSNWYCRSVDLWYLAEVEWFDSVRADLQKNATFWMNLIQGQESRISWEMKGWSVANKQTCIGLPTPVDHLKNCAVDCRHTEEHLEEHLQALSWTNICSKIIKESPEIHQWVPAWKKGKYWDREGPSAGFERYTLEQQKVWERSDIGLSTGQEVMIYPKWNSIWGNMHRFWLPFVFLWSRDIRNWKGLLNHTFLSQCRIIAYKVTM